MQALRVSRRRNLQPPSWPTTPSSNLHVQPPLRLVRRPPSTRAPHILPADVLAGTFARTALRYETLLLTCTYAKIPCSKLFVSIAERAQLHTNTQHVQRSRRTSPVTPLLRCCALLLPLPTWPMARSQARDKIKQCLRSHQLKLCGASCSRWCQPEL